MKRDNVVINIYHNLPEKDIEEGLLDELLYGIEEEGIPWNLLSYNEDLNFEALAIKAAEESKLNIGIGIDKQGRTCIKHTNFKEGQNLFESNIWDRDMKLRDYGMNSARLFKGVPFNL